MAKTKRSTRKTKPKTFSAKFKKELDRAKEWRYYYMVHGATTVSTSGQLAGVIAGNASSGDGIAQGVDDVQRSGDVIQIKTLEYIGEYTMPSAGSSADSNLDASDTIRLILAYDRRPDGAFPAVADILYLSDIVSPYTHDNVRNGGRFEILHDSMVTVTAPTDTHYNNGSAEFYTYRHANSHFVRWKKSFKKPLTVKYRENADGEIDDIDKGNIFACLVSQRGTATWNGLFKVEFKDK